MAKDAYEPLATLRPPGFSLAFLGAIDAGLRMAPANRPQSIAEWRAMLDRSSMLDPSSAAPRRGFGLGIGLAAAAILVLAGGGFYFFSLQPSAPAPSAARVAEKAAPETTAQTGPPDQSQQEREELARLRAAAAAREKAAQDAALKRQVEEETRLKIEAEMAEKKRVEDETRRKAAETAEAALGLTTIDRQHVQAALVALSFGVVLMDGIFEQWTRNAITEWQNAGGSGRDVQIRRRAEKVRGGKEEGGKGTSLVACARLPAVGGRQENHTCLGWIYQGWPKMRCDRGVWRSRLPEEI
jgi:hypothetical protein